MRDYSKFFTPSKTARRLIEFADVFPGMKILEPHAGRGHIVAELRMRFGMAVCVHSVELNNDFYEDLASVSSALTIGDFLRFTSSGQYDRVIANPPFGNGVDLVKHFYHMIAHLKPNGILSTVLPMDFEIPSCAHVLYSSQIENWSKNSDGSLTKIKHVKAMPMPHYAKLNTIKNVLELAHEDLRPVWGCGVAETATGILKAIEIIDTLK